MWVIFFSGSCSGKKRSSNGRQGSTEKSILDRAAGEIDIRQDSATKSIAGRRNSQTTNQ
jgi:hypothetical protein